LQDATPNTNVQPAFIIPNSRGQNHETFEKNDLKTSKVLEQAWQKGDPFFGNPQNRSQSIDVPPKHLLAFSTMAFDIGLRKGMPVKFPLAKDLHHRLQPPKENKGTWGGWSWFPPSQSPDQKSKERWSNYSPFARKPALANAGPQWSRESSLIFPWHDQTESAIELTLHTPNPQPTETALPRQETYLDSNRVPNRDLTERPPHSLSQVAERVYRILEQRLTIERERRGHF